MEMNSGDVLLGIGIDYHDTCISCDVGGSEPPESAVCRRLYETL